MTGMTEDLDPDLDWARDLFDRARGAGEPAWAADAPTLARAGDRRRRLRAVGAGGGLAGVVAVTVALAVGLGAGATDLGSQPGPGGGWGNRPLSDVFKYTLSQNTLDRSGHSSLPAPAAVDLAAVLGRLDPSFTHLVGSHDHAHDPRIVAPGNWGDLLTLSSVWADDSPRQSGELTFEFASSAGWAQTLGVTDLDTSRLHAPCTIPFGAVGPAAGSSLAPKSPAQWSSCTVSPLPDGSTIASASTPVGPGTAVVVVRQFADGELFTVVAEDFNAIPGFSGAAPDPATVVKPTPWTEQSLVAALSDPAVRSGWSPIPPPNSDGRFLLPSDFGKGWSFDTGQADRGTIGEFVISGGCADDQHVALAKPGSDAYYWGPLPNGVSGSAYEGEFFLRKGSGPATMAKARAAAAQTGCKAENVPVDYSKDTLIALPPGIGDDAFATSVPALGMVSVDVRIGDVILRTDVSNANHVRDQSWTDKKPLDLSSQADQQWLAGIARSMVSRYAGGGAHH